MSSEGSATLFYGLDVGSTTAKLVILNSSLSILHVSDIRTHGRSLEGARALLAGIPGSMLPGPGAFFAFTGTGGRLLADILGGHFVNEIIAHKEAATFFHPQARTILDMGGQDTKLVLLSHNREGRQQVEDFSLNTLCAAGTGSFLDQQAGRLGLTIEELSNLALASQKPARLAGRCAVFAKSDMIHLQQAAVPEQDIVAGLCLALVRNLKATVARGKKIRAPMVFQGGVAANAGVRQALKTVFHLGDGDLIIPEHFRTIGAIGAVLYSRRTGRLEGRFRGLSALDRYLKEKRPTVRRFPRLSVAATGRGVVYAKGPETGKMASLHGAGISLGIDIGSVSTKMVASDPDGRIIAHYYGRTAGNPLKALQKGLDVLFGKLDHRAEIISVGTTGSGRYLAGDFVGADLVVNEITAQARAAVSLDPHVDTIFEIGGQDSKYISINNGTVRDFMMNRACAAGTGSFLEEQAVRLGVRLDEFGKMALDAENPVRMGERCTVFMESDLIHYQQQGVNTPDLVAGLCYSIVRNYLNKVVENRVIGKRIFYQGATALNPGIVAAFEAILGRRITVPEHCELTGARGAAMLAMERTKGPTKFRGTDVSQVPYEIRSFECRACPNRCSISKVNVKGCPPLFYGGRCERYETRLQAKDSGTPDLVGERHKRLLEYGVASLEEAERAPRGPVGIPACLILQEWMPFFATLLKELGFGPVLSGETGKLLIHKGIETMVTEPCFPVKVAHGHVKSLLDAGLRKIFFPAIIELPVPKGIRTGQVCPYVQSIPYTLPAAIDFESYGAELINPPLRLNGCQGLEGETKSRLAAALETGGKEFGRAWDAAVEAQRSFQRDLLERGRKAIDGLETGQRAVVLVGRPYNALDPGANLGVHEKFRRMGVLVLPLDHLPLDDYIREVPAHESMYWHYGQKILSAGLLIARDPRLKGVYITNFGCGPDSFLLHYFKDISQGKPFLELEIDEHSADAGILTRIEAFWDTADAASSAALENGKDQDRTLRPLPSGRRHTGGKRRTIYIPPMSDHAHVLAAALNACGVKAVVLPPTDDESIALGLQHTSGKECFPAILTTGDMLKMTRQPDFSPENAAFLMPGGAGPCRFGQYQRLHRKILDRIGLEEVPLFTPNQDIRFYDEVDSLGKGFSRLAWNGIVAVDLLDSMCRHVRPYVDDPSSVDKVYENALVQLCSGIMMRSPLTHILEQTRRELDRMPVNRPEDRVVIGVVGEIYTRANPKANAALIRHLEGLGAEVWLPSVSEWILYTNFTAIRRARREKAWKEYFKLTLKNRVQVKDMKRLEAAAGPMPSGREPLTREILRWAAPFVSDEFEGESILSVGKAVSYLRSGISGIINVMPLTCMPGTIVNALLSRVRNTMGARPFLALACDGQQETGRMLRLEAFVSQARESRGDFLSVTSNEMR